MMDESTDFRLVVFTLFTINSVHLIMALLTVEKVGLSPITLYIYIYIYIYKQAGRLT